MAHILQTVRPALLETNMETQKGPIKATVPLTWGYMGFHVSLGECIRAEGSRFRVRVQALEFRMYSRVLDPQTGIEPCGHRRYAQAYRLVPTELEVRKRHVEASVKLS